MKIADFCTKLEAVLTAKTDGKERLDTIVQALRQAFRLQPDEVAILLHDADGESLRFLCPAKLAKTGSIPLSSRESLAARTLRENKPFVNNRFTATFHASIFEQVKLDPTSGERPLPIQKIISVPLPGDGAPRGVVQLSRKGAEAAQAGDDFSKDELQALTEIAAIVSRYV